MERAGERRRYVGRISGVQGDGPASQPAERAFCVLAPRNSKTAAGAESSSGILMSDVPDRELYLGLALPRLTEATKRVNRTCRRGLRGMESWKFEIWIEKR